MPVGMKYQKVGAGEQVLTKVDQVQATMPIRCALKKVIANAMCHSSFNSGLVAQIGSAVAEAVKGSSNRPA